MMVVWELVGSGIIVVVLVGPVREVGLIGLSLGMIIVIVVLRRVQM